MRRISLAMALIGAVAATGCTGSKAPRIDTSTGVAKGVPNVNYYVNLFTPPLGGTVTSDVGGINCGASAVQGGVDNDADPLTPPVNVYTYYTAGVTDHCGQTQFLWSQATVTLTATPAGTNTFIGWAGDCTGSSPTCTVARGADKTIVAIFGAAGSGHANYMDGAVHGPAYAAYTSGAAGALVCSNCHGPTLAGKGIAPSCGTCHPNPGPAGNSTLPSSAVKTGLQVAVTGVSKDAVTGAISVAFTAKDDAGANVDLTGADGKNAPMSLRIAMGSFGLDASSRVLPYAMVTPYVTSNKAWTASAITMPAVGAAVGKDGQLAGTPGAYTYTFPYVTTNDCGTVGVTCGPVALNPAKVGDTHTIWIQATRQENVTVTTDARMFTAVNAEYNFNAADFTASTARREIASTAGCNKCHAGFKPGVATNVGGFHGYGRIEAPFCNACHVEGRGTLGFADSATFVHRIHFGKELTQVTTGTVGDGYYQGATSCKAATPCTCTVAAPCSMAFHGMTATYPQDVRNCDACHAGAVNGAQATTRPTIAACGSCHDQLATTFLPVGTVSLPAHPASNPAVRTNADCAVCHTPAAIANVHVPTAPIDPCNTFSFAVAPAACATGAANSRTNSGVLPAAGKLPAGAAVMRAVIGSVQVEANGNPSMNFKLTKDGADVVFNTYAAQGDEMITGFTGSPNIYFAFSVPQDGVAAPDDFNVTYNTFLKKVWNGTTTTGNGVGTLTAAPDAGGFYKITLTNVFVPPSAGILTGGVGYAYSLTANANPDLVVQPLNQTNLAAFPYDTTTHVGGLVVAMPNVWKTATGYAARRTIVDNARCNDCHVQLGANPSFHVGQRNDGPTCSFCHFPNLASSGWSANSKEFLHALHAGPERSVPFMWHAVSATDNFSEVEFPRPIADCQACHTPGTYDLSASAFTASAPELLWSTVANGTPAAVISTSPYVTVGTVYGSGFAFNGTTPAGTITAPAATTLVSSPISSACFACHDTATARTHMEQSGGWLYKARGSSFDVSTVAGETCVSCHGPGATWAIDLVH